MKRNFQILPALDFLAEFTQHIPPKGSHLIRYYGWYSNKSRGMRKKAQAAVSDEPSSEEPTTSRSSQAWAMLIKRVYEVDPLCCVRVRRPDEGGVVHRTSPGGRDRRDPQALPLVAGAPPREGHQKWIIWSSSSRASYMDSSIDSQDQAEPPELTYIDIDPFLESF